MKDNKDSMQAEPQELKEQEKQPNKNKLAAKLSQMEELANQYKDEALRWRAEFENYRKRMLRDISDIRKTAAMNMIEELLPVLDNLSLGIQSAQKEGISDNIIQGFKLVYDQLHSNLTEQGLKELNPINQAFDPNYHECVSTVPSETIAENNIVQVIRVGYSLHDRLLRPATVIVSKGTEPTEEHNKKND